MSYRTRRVIYAAMLLASVTPAAVPTQAPVEAAAPAEPCVQAVTTKAVGAAFKTCRATATGGVDFLPIQNMNSL